MKHREFLILPSNAVLWKEGFKELAAAEIFLTLKKSLKIVKHSVHHLSTIKSTKVE